MFLCASAPRKVSLRKSPGQQSLCESLRALFSTQGLFSAQRTRKVVRLPRRSRQRVARKLKTVAIEQADPRKGSASPRVARANQKVAKVPTWFLHIGHACHRSRAHIKHAAPQGTRFSRKMSRALSRANFQAQFAARVLSRYLLCTSSCASCSALYSRATNSSRYLLCACSGTTFCGSSCASCSRGALALFARSTCALALLALHILSCYLLCMCSPAICSVCAGLLALHVLSCYLHFWCYSMCCDATCSLLPCILFCM